VTFAVLPTLARIAGSPERRRLPKQRRAVKVNVGAGTALETLYFFAGDGTCGN
jgi:hypothetical protein